MSENRKKQGNGHTPAELSAYWIYKDNVYNKIAYFV